MTLGPHLLGRIEPEDQVPQQLHPYTTLVPPAAVEVVIPPPTLSEYNQGQTPRCVGYSISRVINWFNKYAFDADWLYAECKKIDPWPNEDGTSARYACDVLRREGHWRTIRSLPVKAGPRVVHGIASNTWALSVDDIRHVFADAKPQPVVLGTEWLENWFQPTHRNSEYWLQDIAAGGRSAGGHEYGLWACSDARQAFGIRNTWGPDWPPLVWQSYDTVATLLDRGGDACVLHDLASR
jgi:hypothetical protein